jgi:Skp family chaperone for outer membrane proteins
VAAVAAAAAVTLAGASLPQGNPTFAYLNTQAVLQQTPGFAAADSIWSAEVAVIRAGLEVLSEQLDSALAAFEQASAALSPTERDARRNELQRLNRLYQERTTEAQTRADARQRELMAPLQDRVRSVVEGIRAERNLGIVFDVAAPGSGIVSADPQLDLTTLVVRRLRGTE